jgi:hypothetical protein
LICLLLKCPVTSERVRVRIRDMPPVLEDAAPSAHELVAGEAARESEAGEDAVAPLSAHLTDSAKAQLDPKDDGGDNDAQLLDELGAILDDSCESEDGNEADLSFDNAGRQPDAFAQGDEKPAPLVDPVAPELRDTVGDRKEQECSELEQQISEKQNKANSSRSLVDMVRSGAASCASGYGSGDRVAAVMADAAWLAAEPPKEPPVARRTVAVGFSEERSMTEEARRPLVARRPALFAALGKRARSNNDEIAHRTFDFDDDRFGRMRLRQSPFSQVAFAARWDGHVIVDIADLSDDPVALNAGQLGDRVVFGCLVKKHEKKRAKDGRMYAVWTLTNMAAGERASRRRGQRSASEKLFTSVICLVFDDAFDAFHTQVEGAVFALKNPVLLPPKPRSDSVPSVQAHSQQDGLHRKPSPRDDDWSGICIKVSKRTQVIFVGVCADFGICNKILRDGSHCGVWFNAKIGVLCPKHAADLLVNRAGSIRMDINNQERPGITRDCLVGTMGPIDITRGEDLHPIHTSVLDLKAARDRLGRDKFTSRLERSKASTLRAEILRKKSLPSGTERHRGSKPDQLRALLEKDMRLKQASAAAAKPTFMYPLGAKCTSVKNAMPSKLLHVPYQTAVNSLIRIGFSPNSEGGLDPPPEEIVRKLGIALLKSPALTDVPSCTEGTVTAGPGDGAIVLADVNGQNHDDFEEHYEPERRQINAPSVVRGKSNSCRNGVFPSSLSSLNGINASAEQGTTRVTVKAVSFIASSESPASNTQPSPLPVNVVRSCSSTSLRSPKAHDQDLELSDDSEQA